MCALISAILLFLFEREFWLPHNLSLEIFKPMKYADITKHGYSLNDFHQSYFDDFGMCFWFSLVTMTTLGYGDMFPSSREGRVVAIGTCIVGICVTSLIVGVVTNKLTPSKYETYMINWRTTKKMKKMKIVIATKILQQVWRFRKNWSKGPEINRMPFLDKPSAHRAKKAQDQRRYRAAMFLAIRPLVKKFQIQRLMEQHFNEQNGIQDNGDTASFGHRAASTSTPATAESLSSSESETRSAVLNRLSVLEDRSDQQMQHLRTIEDLLKKLDKKLS